MNFNADYVRTREYVYEKSEFYTVKTFKILNIYLCKTSINSATIFILLVNLKKLL